jgi:hypothetical protein
MILSVSEYSQSVGAVPCARPHQRRSHKQSGTMFEMVRVPTRGTPTGCGRVALI